LRIAALALAISRRSTIAINRPKRVLEGKNPIEPVLLMVVVGMVLGMVLVVVMILKALSLWLGRSGLRGVPRQSSIIKVYQMPDTTDLFA
jgi:hypothetical protein